MDQVAEGDGVQKVFVDWDLGRDEGSSGRDEVGYWKLVQQRIHEVPRKMKRPYTQLLLTGIVRINEMFLKVLKDALGDVAASAGFEVIKSGIADLSFAVARGAAELQRR